MRGRPGAAAAVVAALPVLLLLLLLLLLLDKMAILTPCLAARPAPVPEEPAGTELTFSTAVSVWKRPGGGRWIIIGCKSCTISVYDVRN